MRWQMGRRSQNVQDRRGMGGKTLAGGGVGFFAIAVVVGLLGGDPSMFIAEGINRTVQGVSSAQKIPKAEQDELVEFVSVVLAQTEDVWHEEFKRLGYSYREPALVIFSGYVDSACGTANAAIGPFYCPLDQTLYLDLNFFYDLKHRHQAPGDFAQAYVIAHEVGHHVEQLTGILEKAQRAQSQSPRSANQLSVKVELMADCLAGVWAKKVDEKGLLEPGDVKEALNAASQIGDDRLQEQGQGYVVPDSFTHGTAEQRYRAFQTGYEGSAAPLKNCAL